MMTYAAFAIILGFFYLIFLIAFTAVAIAGDMTGDDWIGIAMGILVCVAIIYGIIIGSNELLQLALSGLSGIESV